MNLYDQVKELDPSLVEEVPKAPPKLGGLCKISYDVVRPLDKRTLPSVRNVIVVWWWKGPKFHGWLRTNCKQRWDRRWEGNHWRYLFLLAEDAIRFHDEFA